MVWLYREHTIQPCHILSPVSTTAFEFEIVLLQTTLTVRIIHKDAL